MMEISGKSGKLVGGSILNKWDMSYFIVHVYTHTHIYTNTHICMYNSDDRANFFYFYFTSICT